MIKMNIHWPVWAFFSQIYFEIQSRDVAVQRLYGAVQRLYGAAQRPKSQRNVQNHNKIQYSNTLFSTIK
jgi:hypothetical protein